MTISKDTPAEEALEKGSKCDRCGHCCSYGGGFVLKHEVAGLAEHMGMTEEQFRERYLDEKESFNTKHYKFRQRKYPYGECVFLDGKECTIHEVKPLHCRVGNCSEHGRDLSIWFALNHFVDENDPESVRQWARYLEVQPTIEGGKLEDLVPDEEKLKKILSYINL